MVLTAGVDVLDVKDPGRGPLGCPSAEVISAISHLISGSSVVPKPLFSLACGEVVDWLSPTRPVISPDLLRQPEFVKFGTARLSGRSQVEARDDILTACERALGTTTPASLPRRILVAYAEESAVGAPEIEAVLGLIVALGWEGLLIDTALKQGPSLLALQSRQRLQKLSQACHQAGVLFALAGKLMATDLEALAEIGPDFVGIRSAACEGTDRLQSVSAARIRDFRTSMSNASINAIHSEPRLENESG